MKRRPTKEQSEQLASRILRVLADRPLRTADSLSEELGFSINSIRARLIEMMDNGRIVGVDSKGKTAGAVVKLWRLSSEQDTLVFDGGDKKQGGMLEVYQVTRSTYADIGQRDPLVAALFGPAHREAA
jgi:predicted ArsR family transcriptional regulator